MTNKLVVATGNAGKLREFKRIFEPLGVEVSSAAELGINIEPEETGSTFAENAKIKAQAVLELCMLPTIADDSGLCVDALDGAPGVYSARYAGEHCTDEQCIEKLLLALADVPKGKRGAHFSCAICCLFPDGTELTTEGKCYGEINFAKQGEGGFGYDPVFLTEHGCFAELTGEQKDTVSHRGEALREFYEKYKNINYNSEVKTLLTSKQRSTLRAHANKLETILQVGKAGIADTLIKQVDDALTARELIKLHVLETSPTEVRETAEEMAEKTRSEVVQVIGMRFVLYRKNHKNPIYTL